METGDILISLKVQSEDALTLKFGKLVGVEKDMTHFLHSAGNNLHVVENAWENGKLEYHIHRVVKHFSQLSL